MSNFIIQGPGAGLSRGLSGALWGDCPRDEIRNNPGVGWYFEDNFVDLPTGKYTVTQAGTSGTFTLADAARGVAVADAGDEDDGDGANIQKPGELFIPTAGSIIWCEFIINHVSALTTPADLFIGLSETDTTILASSANTSTNHIGFESVSEDGVLAFVSEKAGSRNSVAAVKSLTANTYTKLGFKVIGTSQILIYIDGVQYGTIVTDSDDIPIVEMTPSLVVQAASIPAAGGTGPKVRIDAWSFYQLLRA